MKSTIQLLGYPHDYGNPHIGIIFTKWLQFRPRSKHPWYRQHRSIHVEMPRLSVAEKVSVFFFDSGEKPTKTGWWFGTMEFYKLPNSWDDDPIWRAHIFQGGRSTTNLKMVI